MAQSPCCLLGFELHDEGQNNYQYHGQGLNGKHISYLYQILRVEDLELVLGLRVLAHRHIQLMKFSPRPWEWPL